MPTLPHEERRIAESFGSDPAAYDRSRPPYPDELIRRLTAPEVLDVGSGTGIVARQLQATGAHVLGVDPDARMAEHARSTGVDTEVATFEDWDPAGRTFDAVVAGQSWHWVDPQRGLATVAEVLRPGGRFAVFAHAYAAPPEVGRALADALARAVPDSPVNPGATADPVAIYQAGFARVADRIRDTGRFTEPEQWRFDTDRSYTRDQWLAQLATTGALTPLTADQRTDILGHVGAAIDALGGGFTIPLTTLAVTATRDAR